MKNFKPDYRFRLKFDRWGLWQAISLLIEVDPKFSYPNGEGISEEFLTAEAKEILVLLMDSIEAGTVQVTPPYQSGVDPGTLKIKPVDFINWANSKELKIPDQLKPLLNQQDALAKNPPYLDPEHPHYSTELATSIKIWLQLFQSGADIKTQPHPLIDQIKAALKEKGFAGARENSRLATGINPNWNKRGGSTKNKRTKTKKITPVKK